MKQYYGKIRIFEAPVRRYFGMLLLSAMIGLSLGACVRRPLEDLELPPAALIPVKIDWSRSGFKFSSRSGPSVHRVSLRFFPKDGFLPVFDVYLERNLMEGEIRVPIGRYSVIVFNETLEDEGFWEGRVHFTDVDSFHDFAANAVPYNRNTLTEQFPFYKPQPGEMLIAEPLHLASWSIEHFEVTEKMVPVSFGEQPESFLSDEEYEMFLSLKKVVMLPLTRPVNVTARIGNIVSSHINYLAMQGFTGKVFMSSGQTTQRNTTFLFRLGRRHYEANGKDGSAGASFYCFGRTEAYPESYTIAADVVFVTGELFKPSPPLLFDLTGQVITNYHDRFAIDLAIEYDLPYMEGGIAVDNWDDDVYTLQ